jgi:dolichol kinase
MTEANFWINEFLKAVALFLSAYLLGWAVLKKGIRVNYTRKVIHFIIFFLPIFLLSAIPFKPSVATLLGSGILFVLWNILLSEPFRSRSSFLTTAFASIDRPEDRPFTILWITTQSVFTFAVMIPVIIWLQGYEKEVLIYITVLVAGIGDGLAEPIGVKFGRHKYNVRALFTDRRYTRSLEGSACVLLSGFLAVFLMQQHLNFREFISVLILVPPVMTLAEAFSPHTWDGPFLYLAGGLSTVAALELSRTLIAV